MRITSAYSIQMIDACHIAPFAQLHDDTIQNGIPLYPNLHRAFDRGLLTINEHYQIVVSSQFSETNAAYSIRPLAGATILLPTSGKYGPALCNLA